MLKVLKAKMRPDGIIKLFAIGRFDNSVRPVATALRTLHLPYCLLLPVPV